MRASKAVVVALLCAFLSNAGPPSVQASDHHASGGGTYFVEPGILSEFQFDKAHVQCKVGHAVLADGTTFASNTVSIAIDDLSAQ